jgi:hypothetical protein
VEFEVADVDYQQMKTDLDAYPFGQCPRCGLWRTRERRGRHSSSTRQHSSLAATA